MPSVLAKTVADPLAEGTTQPCPSASSDTMSLFLPNAVRDPHGAAVRRVAFPDRWIKRPCGSDRGLCVFFCSSAALSAEGKGFRRQSGGTPDWVSVAAPL